MMVGSWRGGGDYGDDYDCDMDYGDSDIDDDVVREEENGCEHLSGLLIFSFLYIQAMYFFILLTACFLCLHNIWIPCCVAVVTPRRLRIPGMR